MCDVPPRFGYPMWCDHGRPPRETYILANASVTRERYTNVSVEPFGAMYTRHQAWFVYPDDVLLSTIAQLTFRKSCDFSS